MLYLCYKSKKEIPEFALKEWAMLNPEFQIETFGDVEIIEFLQKEFGSATVNAFKNIKHGPIKADFFRFHMTASVAVGGGAYALSRATATATSRRAWAPARVCFTRRP